jgi:hypothetical protein
MHTVRKEMNFEVSIALVLCSTVRRELNVQVTLGFNFPDYTVREERTCKLDPNGSSDTLLERS